MRLANDIELLIGREAVTLRASLRAAIALERKYQGFDSLLKAVMAGSLTAIADIVKHASNGSGTLTRYLEAAEGNPIGITIAELTPQLAAFVFDLAGIDPNSKPAPASKSMAFSDYHLRLYRIATGYMGWTPAQALDATPYEIIEAQRGRMDMLASIFGSAKQEDAEAGTLSSANTRARLAALGNLEVTDMRDVP